MKKLWIINTDKPKSSTLTFADTTEAQLDDVLKWLEKGNPSVSLTEICESSSMLQLVLERKRQDAKWGGHEHDDQHSTQEFVQLIEDYAGWARTMSGMNSHQKARNRLIQVAALAVAAAESLDRKHDLGA